MALEPIHFRWRVREKEGVGDDEPELIAVLGIAFQLAAMRELLLSLSLYLSHVVACFEPTPLNYGFMAELEPEAIPGVHGGVTHRICLCLSPFAPGNLTRS